MNVNVTTPDEQLLNMLKIKGEKIGMDQSVFDLAFVESVIPFKKKMVEKLFQSIERDEEVLQEMSDAVKSSYDAEQAAAVASLSKSIGDKYKLITEIMMQTERIESTEKIKKLEMENKKELAQLKTGPASSPQTLIQNNTFIAGREEALRLAENNSEEILDGSFNISKVVIPANPE